MTVGASRLLSVFPFPSLQSTGSLILLRDIQSDVLGGTYALRAASSLSLEVMFVMGLGTRIVHLPPFDITEVTEPHV